MRRERRKTGGGVSGGEAAAIHAADRAGRQQQRGVPAGRDQPQDGEPLAVRADGPEFRRGAVIYPPVKIETPRPRSPRYLSERGTIRSPICRAGESVRGIAEELGSAPSTIVARSGATATGRPLPAPSRAAARRRRRSASRATRRVAGDEVLAGVVSGCWPSAGARSRSRTSCGCCSRISRRAGCARRRSIRRSTTPRSSLTRPARRRRRRRAAPGSAAPRTADGDAMIDERPVEVEDRVQARPLGGRSDHGRREPVGDRHAGGAHDPVPDPAAVP